MSTTQIHVNPVAEVLDRYVDPSFRPRLAELAPYRVPAGRPTADGSSSIPTVLAENSTPASWGAAPHPTFTGRSTTWRGSKDPRPGVQDDQAANRVQDMDDEGSDVHFLIPASWTSAVGLEDVESWNWA